MPLPSVANLKTFSLAKLKYLRLTRRPPAIMAVIATAALTAASPRASAMAWNPI